MGEFARADLPIFSRGPVSMPGKFQISFPVRYQDTDSR
jgi:hypothetical protein